MLSANHSTLLRIAGSIVSVLMLGAVVFLWVVYGNVDKQVAKLEGMVSVYQEQLDKLETTIEEARQDGKGVKDELIELEDAIAANAVEVAELESQMRQGQEAEDLAAADLKAEVAKLEGMVSVYQEQLDKLETTIEEVRGDHRGIKDVLIRVEGELAANQASISELESQIRHDQQTLAAEIASMKAETERLWNDGIAPLKQRLLGLESRPSLSFNVAYISAEDAFSVFTDAVSDLRQLAVDKEGEITKLQQQYMASTISKDEYDSQYRELQVELLQAQLNIDMGTIDKMIASSGFSDMKTDLQLLKDEAQPVVDEMKNLVSTVRVGVIDATEFENRYTQVKNAFSQLDQLLTQAATAKIVQAANKIAQSEGYDIVLRAKNVIVYRNKDKIEDITELVKEELSSNL